MLKNASLPSFITPGKGTDARTGWLTEFVPRRGLRNGHLQTIVGNFLPRPAFRIPTQKKRSKWIRRMAAACFAIVIGSPSRCARRG